MKPKHVTHIPTGKSYFLTGEEKRGFFMVAEEYHETTCGNFYNKTDWVEGSELKEIDDSDNNQPPSSTKPPVYSFDPNRSNNGSAG